MSTEERIFSTGGTYIEGSVDTNGGDFVGRDKIINHYQYLERPAPGIPYMAPNLPLHHIPRESELAELRHLLLNRENTVAVTSLRGMGGVGKTTLAIALCHDKQIIEAFSDGVLWASLGPQADTLSIQAAWDTVLGHGLVGLPNSEARTLHLRSLLHDKRCLLVIDDVWDAEHLTPLQVGGPNCATLVTSRERKIAQKVGIACDLDVLKPEQALTLLANWAGEMSNAAKNVADELARQLGYLPLALVLAGAQVQDGETWESLLAAFRDKQGGDVTLLDLDDPKLREESLGLTFSLSVERLMEPLPEQFGLLGIFAAGREAPFNVRAAAAIWQVAPAQAEKSLRRLARAALLDRTGDNYTLHLLVGDYARSRLSQTARQTAEERHQAYYLEIARHSALDWSVTEAVLPQIRLAWGRIARDDEKNLYAWAEATNEFFRKRGYWVDGLAWLEAAHGAARAHNVLKYEGWCAHNLAVSYHYLGRLDEALAYYQMALVSQRKLGERYMEAQALNRIGYINLQRGMLDETYFQESLAIYREINDEAGEGESLHFSGLIYFQQGEFDKALEQFEANLVIQQKLGNRGLEAITQHNLGGIYEQCGDLNTALNCYQVSLTIHREVGDRAAEAATLHNIGRVHEQHGEFEQALKQYEASLSIQREVGNQVWEAYALRSMGRIDLQQGAIADALGKFQASLAILRRVGEQVGVAEVLWQIGTTCENIGRLAEAMQHLTESSALHEALGMPKSSQVRADRERVRSQLENQAP